MNKRNLLFLIFLLAISFGASSQNTDTVWVNTLNFEDITKRRGTYEFPKAGQNWQQIKMHYTLKCDSRTTQDGFPCGEWDYLSYTIVHDSTGIIDSTALQHSNFKIGDLSPDSFYYVQVKPFDTFESRQYTRIVDTVYNSKLAVVGIGAITSAEAFGKRRSQYLFSVAELSAAGLVPGEITAIAFTVVNASGELKDAQIRIGATTKSVINQFEALPNSVSSGTLQMTGAGDYRIECVEPLNWDGTSNLVLEINHNDPSPTANFELAEDASSMGLSSTAVDLRYTLNDNSFLEIEDAANVFGDVDSVITIAFWAKGDQVLPQNTSLFEAKDENGNRIINIHMPWSNRQIYWDAGNSGGSYDRINKTATDNEIKNKWNHWVFVKNAQSGAMNVFLNGNLWHSGTGKTWNMKGISQCRIGKGISNYQYRGELDRLSVWKTSFTAGDAQALMWSEVTNGHAKFSDLVFSFNFDNFNPSSPNILPAQFPAAVSASIHGQIDFELYPVSEIFFDAAPVSSRPKLTFVQADQLSHLDSSIISNTKPTPWYSIALFENPAKPPLRTGFSNGYQAGFVFTYNTDGAKKDSTEVVATFNKKKVLGTYYQKFEVVENIEIARYITPYGIGFDLGPDGFRWEYDVTDYAYLLTDLVTLSSGNQQELIDLRFEFIKGEAPRDLKAISYYANRENRSYNNIANNNNFKEQTLNLHSEAKTFKLTTRITGHGHNTDPGKNHCCEWADKTHYMKIDGKNALQWDIWQDDKCALNPLIDQGGNWAPPRAGWCPGAPVDDYNFDITSFISGNQVRLDYEIEPVPTDNLGQGGGNYVVSFHLMQYGDWKRKNDAAVTHIIKPTNWEFYNRLNPTCAQPRIIIKNTGGNAMASALIKYGVVDGNPIQFGWTGNLAPDASEELDLPFAIWDYLSSSNSLNFFAEIIRVNGVTDEYPGNSRITSSFAVPPVAPTTFDIWFRNNSIPDATVTIKNDQGKVVYEKLDGAAGVLHKTTLNLDPGCYKLECVTENGFGLYYPLIPQVGNGLLRLSGSNGFVQAFNPDFGKSIEHYFTVAHSLNNTKTAPTSWNMYPNPGNGLVTIELNGFMNTPFEMEVYNLSGQLLHQVNGLTNNGLIQIDLREVQAGIYTLRLICNGQMKVFKVVKN